MPRGVPSNTPNRTHRLIGGDRTIDDPRYRMFHNAKHRAKLKNQKQENLEIKILELYEEFEDLQSKMP